MFRSALLILSGNAAASLLLLARNLVVARLIPVADYGIAATFAIAMAVVEMMSAMGLQQQIVQAKNGEDPRFQAALQGFQLLRGVISGVILFALAGVLADFLNVPEAAWAYQVMALVPVLNALTHFDIHRLNRTMVFWPVILTGAVPALLSLFAIWPLAMLYGDYKVMLYAIVIQAVMTAVTSHVVARRPYRLVFDRAIMAQSLRFGWPLLVNGILMFAVFNGDKLIVGRVLGMETLAVFAMGFTLTLTPTLVMAKSAQNFFLPQLSSVDRGNPEGTARFQHLAIVTMQAILIMGLAMIVIIALVGEPVVYALLGDKYAALLPILLWLAIMQVLRVAKAGPALVALATGHTANAMIANTIRMLSLPVCWYVAINTGDLLIIVWVSIVSEILGYIVSMVLMKQRTKVSLSALTWPFLWSAFLLGGAAMLSYDLPIGSVMRFGSVANSLIYVVLGTLILWSCRDLRRYVKQRKIY